MTTLQLKEMSDRIKLQRKKLVHTQESFCEVINISIGSYTKIENAFQKPSLDTLIRISQNLGVSLDYLVFGTNAEEEENSSRGEIFERIIEDTDIVKLKYVSDFLNKISSLE